MITGYLLAIVAAVSFFVGGFFYGEHVTNNARDADLLAERNKAQQRFNEAARELNQLADDLEKARKERQIEIRTITKQVDKIVEHPRYRNECFDNAGLLNANAALTRRPADPSKPNATLPRSNPP